MTAAIDAAAVDHFHTHGWVLVPELVPLVDIEAARAGLFRVYPTPEEVASGERTARTAPFLDAQAFPDGPGRRFRLGQFAGLKDAPTGEVDLDVLALHHRVLDLVEALLGTDDIRLYQADPFAKYSGTAEYEQPLHIDETNHTLVPPRPDGRYPQVQLFLFLSDVTDAHGPTRVVSKTVTHDAAPDGLWFHRAGSLELDEHEVAATGPAGSVLAYHASTVHRGSTMTATGDGRFFFNLGFRPAGIDWVGALPWPRRGTDPAMIRWIEALDVRQLLALGFPPPGHDYWDDETLARTQLRYPNLDLGAFRAP